MGVSTNFYTIYGLKIDWNEEFSEAYEEVYNDSDTPFVLMDGMGGEYMIFGEVLFNSGDDRWGFEHGDTFKEIHTHKLLEIQKEYTDKFYAKFPDFLHLIAPPFKLMTLAHYS